VLPALASISSSLTHWVSHHGVLAVATLMAIDALLPVGGELVMLAAGALAAGAFAGQSPTAFGQDLGTGLQAYLVLASAGTIGYLAGALVGWAIGRRGGDPFLDRWGSLLHLPPARRRRAELWFARRGRWAVFLGRLTPVVRSFISIPAGVLRSPLPSYTLLTLLGSAIWCFGFAGIGWALGSSYHNVDSAFRAVEIGGVVVIVLAGVALSLRRRAVRRERA
jgi:membrane protein DedA with SNARE-associated domain